MHDHQPMPEADPKNSTNPRLRWGILAALIAVLSVAGGAGAWVAWRNMVANQPPVSSTPAATTAQPPTQVEPSPTTSTSAPTEQTAQVYWLKSTETRIELVPRPIASANSDRPEAALNAAFSELLKGSSNSDLSSTIPEGTELRRLELKQDGIHIDLSKSFTEGGGSTSMTGRLGQVIYTATSLEPNAKVWISVEGEPLETLGGEGLLIEQPMTRADFDANFPL